MILLVCTLVSIVSCSQAAGAEVAYVSRSGQPNTTLLLPALQSGATTIVLLDDEYVLGEEFDRYIGDPLKLKRSVWILMLDRALLDAAAGLLNSCCCTSTTHLFPLMLLPLLVMVMQECDTHRPSRQTARPRPPV